MLNFRRREAEPSAAASPRTAEPATGPNARAQALLAMLGDSAKGMGLDGGAQGGSIPPEQLRQMARDLVAQVESREGSGRSKPSVPARPAPASATASVTDTASSPDPAPRRSLFSKPAPLTTSDPDPVAEVAISQAQVRHARFSMPAPIQPAARPQTASILLPKDDLRRLVTEGLDPSHPGREHPAIVALTLEGLPPLEQAAALRRLPRGQARGVHRALRLREAAGG